MQVVQPIMPGQVVFPGLFAAPPASSTSGVVVDPFLAASNAPIGPVDPLALGAPSETYGDGGPSRINIPAGDRDWTWEQIVDVFDDYFTIQRERQVQVAGEVIAEGRIEGRPKIGATVLEPHKLDSVGRYNRWESTFQTIRRRAAVRVIPDAAGYIVDVNVEKDLEDLARPENATSGASSFRNDDSLTSDRDEFVSKTRLATNWILLGRDVPLERQILADIQQRLAVAPTGSPATHGFVAPGQQQMP